MKGDNNMKEITKIRKAVCTMANELKKAGYSLSQAFKKAWSRIKLSMTVRVTGTTFENRQERLAFLQQFKAKDLSVTLEREHENQYDDNAIKVVVHIKSIKRRTVIGYVPKRLARELAKVIDTGVQVKAYLMQIIGGYSYKETLGALINITIQEERKMESKTLTVEECIRRYEAEQIACIIEDGAVVGFVEEQKKPMQEVATLSRAVTQQINK